MAIRLLSAPGGAACGTTAARGRAMPGLVRLAVQVMCMAVDYKVAHK